MFSTSTPGSWSHWYFPYFYIRTYCLTFQNPEISITNVEAEKLSYITYIGSALSVVFTFISLIVFIWLQ